MRCLPRRVVLTALVLLAAGCGPAPPRPTELRTLRLGTGMPGGGFLSLSTELLPAINERLKGIRVQLVETEGAVDNLRSVADGDLDCAFVFADIVYQAYNRNLSNDLTSVAGIGVVQTAPLQLIAAPASSIRSVRQLRGRRVAIGSEGTATLALATLLLRSAGLSLADIEPIGVPLSDAAQLLVRNELDALFDLAAYSSAIEGAVAAGATLVPIATSEIDWIRAARPFLHAMLIPAGTYRGLVQSVPAIGVDGVVVCQKELDDDTAYAFTAALFAALRGLPDSNRWNLVTLEQASGTSVPLHSGSTRYFRELQLSR
jgi:uncharacterized protein